MSSDPKNPDGREAALQTGVMTEIVSALASRADGWINAITGLGGPRDKVAATRYSSLVHKLNDGQLAAMYATEAFSARIVDVYPREAMREGYEIGGLEPEAGSEKRGPVTQPGTPGSEDESADPDADGRAQRRDPFDGAELDDKDDPRADTWLAGHLRALANSYRTDEYKPGTKKDEDLERKICEYLEPYNVDAMFTDAAIWGRLFGGAAIVLGGASVDEDAREFKPGMAINYLRVVDKRFLSPNMSGPAGQHTPYPLDKQGRPLWYNVNPIQAAQSEGQKPSTTLHRSRLVLFPGDRTDDMTRVNDLETWDFSVLQRPYNELKGDASVWDDARALVKEASVSVTSVKGLFGMVAGKQKEFLAERLRLMQLSRSISKGLTLDMDQEKYERIAATFAGLSDLADHSIKRVAAAAEMPVTILIGEAPAGLNATGDSDLRWFFARVNAYRTLVLEPRLKQLLIALLAQPGGPVSADKAARLTIKWPELWTPSAKERAEIYSQTATADAVYITNQVATPEEIALSRFGEDGYSQETKIDRELREEMLVPVTAMPEPLDADAEFGQDTGTEDLENAEADTEETELASESDPGAGKGGGLAKDRAASGRDADGSGGASALPNPQPGKGTALAGPGKAGVPGKPARPVGPARPGPALGGGSAGAAAPPDKQKEAMNGAQVAALQELVRATAAGEIPRESMQAILELSFGLTPAEAARIVPPEDFEPVEPKPEFGFGGGFGGKGGPPGAPGADGGKGGGAPPFGGKGDKAAPGKGEDPTEKPAGAPPFAKG
jgi:phage-related protein (TIGR01555 family)